jgi:hypothetical protein
MHRASLAAAVAGILIAAGCGGATGPGQGGGYPLSPQGSVDLGAPVTDIAFIGDDVLAVSGGEVCFIDGGMAYLLAGVPTGSAGLTAATATPDGGYALAAGDSCLYRVSNQTYLLQDSLDVGGKVEELVMHDYAGEVWVLLSDGDIVAVDVDGMAVSATVSPGAFGTGCALYAAGLQSLYRAGDDGVQRLPVPGLSVQVEAGLPAAAADLAVLGGYLFVAMDGGGLRALSAYSLSTARDYGLAECGAVDAVSGASVLMAGTATGLSALEPESGSSLGEYSAGSGATLLVVSPGGSRAAAVFAAQPASVQVFGSD